jgi:hypothetical protein
MDVGKVAQNVGNWLVDGPKNVCANIDPLTDVMKLVQRINDIFKPFFTFFPLQQISSCFANITEFVGARSFFGRISDLVSGKAAWEKPLSDNVPNFLRIASKCAYLIGDFASTAKWLCSIQILGAWVKDSTAQIVSWGKEFNILKGICDVSCVTGALLNMTDTVRLIIDEFKHDAYIKQGRLNVSLVVDHVLDVASDVVKIGAAVLSNIPGVNIIFTLVSLSIGSILSLGKFFKKTYWIEPAQLPPSPTPSPEPSRSVPEADRKGGGSGRSPADFSAESLELNPERGSAGDSLPKDLTEVA